MLRRLLIAVAVAGVLSSSACVSLCQTSSGSCACDDLFLGEGSTACDFGWPGSTLVSSEFEEAERLPLPNGLTAMAY